ncbi:uncharacterized protein CLUP02_11904 [Colletotrichum lupini]|uniref:Uncharacterized protein n=1 Tax=Colletotrichum lupini TaxID=145971 RepID=A0A9Q8T038_9PEZI|nr:uncharacterized protein CLUP02_11904 [Colletotrichum lupini]UQC86403.1 hypothetical protein CLUP02_11904 [Colletotrichum lupini]
MPGTTGKRHTQSSLPGRECFVGQDADDILKAATRAWTPGLKQRDRVAMQHGNRIAGPFLADHFVASFNATLAPFFEQSNTPFEKQPIRGWRSTLCDFAGSCENVVKGGKGGAFVGVFGCAATLSQEGASRVCCRRTGVPRASLRKGHSLENSNENQLNGTQPGQDSAELDVTMSLCLDDGLGAAREIFIMWAECGQLMFKEDYGRGNSVSPITQSPSTVNRDVLSKNHNQITRLSVRPWMVFEVFSGPRNCSKTRGRKSAARLSCQANTLHLIDDRMSGCNKMRLKSATTGFTTKSGRFYGYQPSFAIVLGSLLRSRISTIIGPALLSADPTRFFGAAHAVWIPAVSFEDPLFGTLVSEFLHAVLAAYDENGATKTSWSAHR